ncbi:hypothetical protein EAX61_13405 [Dokdonia sinensis]|uniref:Uncharacterized protein n=1 Tax=Dokdonia sinensis TaxID=2479847 RepID=A0A3M0FWF1_9FLAO|nr:hypothetical protein [Dokdonia sinensis]RMB56788.1 hypothetical protein EAX61_13405 [Dokdonia sinensis]
MSLFFFQSCSDDEVENIIKQSNTGKSTIAGIADENFLEQTPIQLGKQLLNPYSVTRMQAAVNFYNNVVPNSRFQQKIIPATHLYIKFSPTTEDHLIILDSLDNDLNNKDVVLQDYPLDYLIINEGDYFVEPQDEQDLYHDIYTTVPEDFNFPDNLPYTILEYLYQPPLEEIEIETIALVQAGWQEDIIEDYGSEILERDLPYFLNNTSRETMRAPKFTPRGRVTIRNTRTGNEEALRRAKISTGRGVWWRYTYTDEDGNFTATKRYRGKVRVRAKWRGTEVSVRRTLNEMLGIQVSDHLMTLRRSSNNRTKLIEPHHEHLWYKGTVHNGIMTYNDFVNETNIGFPHQSSVVWAWKNGDASSTPMLHRYPQLPYYSVLTGYSQFAVWGTITSAYIGMVPPWFRPDQILGNLQGKEVNGQVNTGRIEQLIFHESAHYTHARKIGSFAYAQIFSSEINNQIAHGDPYHEGTTPTDSAGEFIALAEGWATYIEWKAMESRDPFNEGWNGNAFINPQAYMNDFRMYTRPMSLARDDNDTFFLNGLLWHYQDQSVANELINDGLILRNGVTGANLGNLRDRVWAAPDNDLSPMIELLESDVRSGSDLRQEAINNNPPTSTNRINLLFESYGY